MSGSPPAAREPQPSVELELQNCSRSYGPVDAVRDVSLGLRAGEIHCLLGDNGAGKSTVIKLMSGVVRPTAGQVLVRGSKQVLTTPRDAVGLGIATVHQDVGIFPLMSVWRNFFVGNEITRRRLGVPVLDSRTMRQIVLEELRRFQITRVDDPDMPAGVLSGGQRQGVAIARAMYFGARILLLDEPTAALGVREARRVVQFMMQAKDRGAALVFITHNPRHALLAGDRFTIMRHGSVVGSMTRGEVDYQELVQLMGGEEIEVEV